jgi:hypothetical protein
MCTDRVYAGTRGGGQNGSPQWHLYKYHHMMAPAYDLPAEVVVIPGDYTKF